MKTEKESLSALTPKILSSLLYWFSLDLTCHLVIESLTLEELCDLSNVPYLTERPFLVL